MVLADQEIQKLPLEGLLTLKTGFMKSPPFHLQQREMKVAGEGRSELRSSVMGAIKLKKRGLDNDVVGRLMGTLDL